ncbi:MAG: TolC family protein [Pseudomonadota bacterium]
MGRRARLSISLAVAALLGPGCAQLGGQFGAGFEGAPVAVSDISLAQAEWIEPAPQDAVPAASWRWFDDPVLSDLLDRALEANLTVQSTRLALEQARIGLRGAEVRAGPTGGIGGPDVSLSQADEGDLSGRVSLGAFARYELDLWDVNARAVEQAGLSVADAEDALITARISLAGALVNTYVQLRVLDADIALTEEQLAITERLRDVAETRFEAGVTTSFELNQFVVLLQSLRSQIQAARTQRRATEQAIAALLGEPPGGVSIAPRAFTDFPVDTLRPDAPITLLAARPDLRRAERALRRADIAIADARAAFLPSVTLRAAADSGGDLRNLAAGLSSGWTLSASLLTALLDDGSRARTLESRRIEARRAVLSYRASVIAALQEVEAALANQNDNLRQAEILALQLSAQEEAARQSEVQYRAGALSADDLVRQQERLLALRGRQVGLWANEVRAKVQLLRSFGVDPGES